MVREGLKDSQSWTFLSGARGINNYRYGGIEMFRKLITQKNQIIPTEEIRLAVNSILGEGSKYWNSAAEYSPKYYDKDSQIAKKAYDEACEKYQLMQKTVAKIVGVWPQGLELVREIQEMAGLGIKMAENDYYCGRYTQSTNMDDPQFPVRSRDFVTRRHQFADMIDNKQLHIQKILVSSKINK